MPLYQRQSTRFSPCVLAPTFNNAATLGDLVQRVQQLGAPLIVVNDGSTDATVAILERLSSITVLSHSVNLGKAAALQTGFTAAVKAGFTHILTIDTDGQHDPEQIPQLLEKAAQSPRALILGKRGDHIAGCPAKNRLGKEVSNLLVWIESGLSVGDSQCGFRVYPAELISSVRCAASRFGYETEILTKAAWNNFPVEEISVNCRYEVATGRVSHFRPLLDSLRAVAMHTRLLLQATPRWPKRIAQALNPVTAWRKLRAMPEARHAVAGGFAVGVFVACTPTLGVQAVLSMFVAKLFRLSPIAALAGSQLSMPPINVAVIAGSLYVGHLLLHQASPGANVWQTAHESFHSIQGLRTVLLDWSVGGAVVGAALAFLAYFILRAALAAGAGKNEPHPAPSGA